MRILTVTHFFENHGGGIERVAGQLCRQFVQFGASVTWAASDADDSPPLPIASTPLRCINPTESLTGLPMPIPGPQSVRRLALEVRKSDLVVIHDSLYVTSILALVIAKVLRKPTILIQHIAGIPFRSRFLRALMAVANHLVTRPMLWAADSRVFISDNVRRDLLGNEPRCRSLLLFNGVDFAVFHRGEVGTSVALSAIEGSRYSRRLLFVGRYVEKKGVRVLHALAKLRPDFLFIFVGSGPIKPQAWGLSNVQDLGPQKQNVVGDLYRKADLLILPSVGEGFPLVIQEAMACGLPTLCGEPVNRADPGAAQWLCGISIDLSDPEASAHRCSNAIDNLNFSDEDRADMAEYAQKHYDWGEMARKILALAENSQRVRIRSMATPN